MLRPLAALRPLALAALSALACGLDDPAVTAATSAGGATGDDTTSTGDVSSASASGSTADATTSSAGASTGESDATGDGSTSTTGDDSTSTASDATSTSEATTGDEGTSTSGEPDTTSGGDTPPPKPCADQDKPPPDVGPRKAINDDPAFIQVYVNNVENLKTDGEQCAGDWTDLIYAMKALKPAPDLFLVQQISDSAQLGALVKRMSDDLPGVFEGIIADADPWPQGSPCGPEKAKQTNAIIFRSGRFSKVGDKHVWQIYANKNDVCVRNGQARTRAVMIKLHDKIADKDVTVASIHWSTAQGGGPDPACAKANILEVDEKLHKKGYAADLLIFGGDFNESDRNDDDGFKGWYAKANGDGGGALNYRDPIYRACQAAKGLHACLDDNWTIVGAQRRIDALFAQDREGCRARTARAHTITFDEADAAALELQGSDSPLNYSDHRAIRAEIYY